MAADDSGWSFADDTPAAPTSPGYLNDDEFALSMDSTFGQGNWSQTGGWRSQQRENALRQQGAQTVAAGHTSAHSQGDPNQPGARDITVQGLTPAQAAAKLQAANFPGSYLPEGAAGTQGAHLHIGMSGTPDQGWSFADDGASAAGGWSFADQPAPKKGGTGGILDAVERGGASVIGGAVKGFGDLLHSFGVVGDAAGQAAAKQGADTGYVVVGSDIIKLTPAQQAQAKQQVATNAPTASPQIEPTAQKLQALGEKIAPQNRSELESVLHGAGEMSPALGSAMVNPALGATVFGVQGYASAHDEAVAKGASRDAVDRAAMENAGVQGVIGSIPVGHVADAFAQGVANPLLRFGARYLYGSAADAALMTGVQTGSNVVARQNYDPDRPWYQQVPEAALQGAAGGVVLRGAHDVASVAGNAAGAVLRPRERAPAAAPNPDTMPETDAIRAYSGMGPQAAEPAARSAPSGFDYDETERRIEQQAEAAGADAHPGLSAAAGFGGMNSYSISGGKKTYSGETAMEWAEENGDHDAAEYVAQRAEKGAVRSQDDYDNRSDLANEPHMAQSLADAKALAAQLRARADALKASGAETAQNRPPPAPPKIGTPVLADTPAGLVHGTVTDVAEDGSPVIQTAVGPVAVDPRKVTPLPVDYEAQRVAHGAPLEQMPQAIADVGEYQRAAPKGYNIFQAMKDLGGIRTKDPDGSPTDAAEVLDGVRRPGLINNKTGLSPDAMRAALQEKGWFGEFDQSQQAEQDGWSIAKPGDDVNELYEAMRQQASGKPVLHPSDENAAMIARRADLDDQMRQAGVGAKDPADVAAAKLAAWRGEQVRNTGPEMEELRQEAHDLGMDERPSAPYDSLLADVVEHASRQPDYDGWAGDRHEGLIDAVLTPEEHEWLTAAGRSPEGEPEPAFPAPVAGREAGTVPGAEEGAGEPRAGAGGGGEGPAGLHQPDQLKPSSSWVVVDRATGKPVMETFKRETAERVNRDKYEVLTTQDWLHRHNQAVKDNGGVEPDMRPALPSERVDLANGPADQLLIPGGERSAQQAAAAREGPLKAKAPQQDAGGLFAPPEPDQNEIKFAKPPPFYSAVERHVQNLALKSASPEQWKATLSNAPGVKREELEWTGINDWLDLFPKGEKVPKDKVEAFLRDNGVKVEEKVLGPAVHDWTPEELDKWEQANAAVRDAQAEVDRLRGRSNAERMSAGAGREEQEAYQRSNDAVEAREALHEQIVGPEHTPEFADWTLPGGEDYRELLFTLPKEANPPATHWDTPGVMAHVRFDTRTAPDGKKVLFLQELQSDWMQKGRDQGFKKPLSVEERQEIDRGVVSAQAEYASASERMRQLRAEIMAHFNAPKTVEQHLETLPRGDGPENARWLRGLDDPVIEAAGVPLERVGTVLDAFKRADLAYNEARQRAHQAESGIPNAPFKSSWPALIMKRMIRFAADHGYDRISWTTGDQQAERYDLSHQIDRINVRPGEGGNYEVLVPSNAGRAINAAGHGIEHSTYGGRSQLRMSADQIREVFGQDLGGRVIEKADNIPLSALADRRYFAEIGADGLRVGGEGMRAFYDRNLVNITNDLIKKYGGKVELGDRGEPDRTRKLSEDILGAREAARLPLSDMDAAVGALRHHDQVVEAIAGSLPVDVVNALAAHGLSPKQFVRDPKVLIDHLSLERVAPIVLGLRHALSETGAGLGARLNEAYVRGLDREVLPALRASDVRTEEARRILAASERGALGRTETRKIASADEGVSAELARFADWHREVREAAGNPDLSQNPHFDITDKMREAATGGFPLFKRREAPAEFGQPKGVSVGAAVPGDREASAFADKVEKAIRRVAPFVEVVPARHITERSTGAKALGVSWRDGLRHIIAWAVDSPDAIGIGRHEAVHAIWDLLRPAEQEALEEASTNEDWKSRYNIQNRYPELEHRGQFQEAVAERFREWNRDGKKGVSDLIDRAFQRIAAILDVVRDLAKRTFGAKVTARDVMSRIESGEVGRRFGRERYPDTFADPNSIPEPAMARRPVNPVAAARAQREAEAQREIDEREGRTPEAKKTYSAINDILGQGVDSSAQKVWNAASKALPDPVTEGLQDAGHAVNLALNPMAAGSPRAQAAAKDFANALRLADNAHERLDKWLNKTFTPEQQRTMWEAADEHGVILRRGEEPGPGQGLNRLTPEEQTAVLELQRRADQAFDEASALGMVKGDGLESYVPRMVVQMTAFGPKVLERSTPRQASKGGNLSTTTGQLRQRKYETTGETEAAAQSAFGEKATVVRNIRTLPLATQRLDRAIAGRTLVNRIKELSSQTGEPLVVESDTKPSDAYFTMDHPAMQVWRPKYVKDAETGKLTAAVDQNGDVVFEAHPLWVSKEFEGPLAAVLNAPPNALDRALVRPLMQLKSKMMGIIMYSPLMHNAVIWGRAVAADPAGLFTFEAYRRGYRAKADPKTMAEAITAGLVPVSRHFQLIDAASIADDGSNFAPGRSWTSQVLGYVPGLFDREAGDTVKRKVDEFGDLWHNKFLWDQVASLQMGLYTKIRDDLMRKSTKFGIDPQTAQRIAAHYANRYAGSLPTEGMGKVARQLANLLLFSRSFTLGNLAAFKDLTKGLPSDVRSQILRDRGVDELQRAQGIARRKAIVMLALDYGFSIASRVVGAAAIAWLTGQAIHWSQDNEEKYKNRVLLRYQSDGTAVYGRLATGKTIEDLGDFATAPVSTTEKKLSPYAKLMLEIASNDKGFGRKLYDPYDHTLGGFGQNIKRMVGHVFASLAPTGQIKGAYDWITGAGGDRKTAALQTVLPVLGITVSKGAPGGPAVGDLYSAEDQHRFLTQEAMPAINQKIRAGDLLGARQDMTKLHIAPGLQAYYIKVARNPGLRLSGRQMRDFLGYATPEQKAQMQNDRAAGAARRAAQAAAAQGEE